MAIIAETIFKDFKNKEDMKTSLRGVPPGPASMTRRVESLSEDRQVLNDLSLDVMDTAQLVVLVRMAFQDSTTKDDFLTLLHLRRE